MHAASSADTTPVREGCEISLSTNLIKHIRVVTVMTVRITRVQ